MPLGVSASTIVLIAAGALALGPRDVPLAARALGRLTGRATAHASKLARAIERATSDDELRGIRDEMRESVKDLRGVAREIGRELKPSGGERGAGRGATTGARTSAATTTTKAAVEATRRENVIPVSAREFGRGSGGGSTGSDVLAAMHEERELAYKAAKLMESGAVDAYLASREREGG